MKNKAYLYKLYVLLLPFGTLFNMHSTEIGFWYYFSASKVVMLIGIFSILHEGHNLINNNTNKWVKMFFYMLIYTFICAIVADICWGECNGESSYSVIPHLIFFNGLFILEFLYSYHCMTTVVKFEDLYPIFKVQSTVLLFVGAIQILTMKGVAIAAVVNDILSFVFCNRSTEYLTTIDRGVTLFGSEPSTVAFICLWLLPFIFICALKSHKKIYIVHAILWTILFLLSGSSSNLISFVTVLICLGSLIKYKKVKTSLYVGSFILGLSIQLIYAHTDLSKIPIVRGDNPTFSYTLYGKVFDVYNNYSTAVRASHVVNGIKVFEEFPITGIGDGLQGYRFNQNAPDWVWDNPYSQEWLNGEAGMVEGGGGFLGSYLSGYGLIGIFILFRFIKRLKQDFSSVKSDDIRFIIYSIAIVIFLYSGWYTMGLNSYIAFVFSLPYAAARKHDYIKI